MASFDFKCNLCDFEHEYNNGKHLPKEMQIPEDNKCPKCEGTLEKLVSRPLKKNFDVLGGYDYIYGRKNRNLLSADKQAKIIQGTANPY